MEIQKIDDKTLRIIKTVPVAFDYDYNTLVKHRANIVAQKEKELAQRNAEIEEVDLLLAQFVKLKMDTTIEEITEEPKG